MKSFRRRRRPNVGDPHGWNSLQEYLNVHDRCMESVRGYFVDDDSLIWSWPAVNSLVLTGQIECHHGLIIHVFKELEQNEFGQVRTVKYAYHAAVAGETDRPIFRYDNAHEHTTAGHQDRHHKHLFNHRTWQEIRPPVWIGYANWPTLAQVIDELFDWWQTDGQFIPELKSRPD